MPDDPSDLLAEVREIRTHMRRMDRRDRMRTFGASLRFILVYGFLIYSTWYVVKHGPAMIQMIAKTAADQARSVTEDQLNALGGSSGTNLQDIYNQIIQQR